MSPGRPALATSWLLEAISEKIVVGFRMSPGRDNLATSWLLEAISEKLWLL
jgi:hypothetical protein